MVGMGPRVILVAWTALIGCGSVDNTLLYEGDFRECGADDSLEWSQLDQPPIGAEILRGMAVADYYQPKYTPKEWWLIRGSDELILCRSKYAPQRSVEGAWWRFKRVHGNWTVIDQNGWIVIS